VTLNINIKDFEDVRRYSFVGTMKVLEEAATCRILLRASTHLQSYMMSLPAEPHWYTGLSKKMDGI